jgi:activator of HSP90 ATPase
MTESIRISATVKATPRQVYDAWLSSKEHGAFTESKAVVSPKVGGRFTAWDNYISGTTVVLDPYKRIVQKWRTTDFSPGVPDSTLEVLLEETVTGTRMTLLHTDIPQGQGDQYKQGWRDYYFKPMKKYFSAKTSA